MELAGLSCIDFGAAMMANVIDGTDARVPRFMGNARIAIGQRYYFGLNSNLPYLAVVRSELGS